MTYKIYVELAIWNLNLKFEPQTIQDLRKLLVLESTKIMHQIIVINFSNILSNYRLCWRQDVHFFCLIYNFFSILSFDFDSFFIVFSNTTICINPEFHNFSSTYFNLIRKFSQHRIENRVILILELKTVWRNFKNTMELMYMNLYGSNTQIWTQI